MSTDWRQLYFPLPLPQIHISVSKQFTDKSCLVCLPTCCSHDTMSNIRWCFSVNTGGTKIICSMSNWPHFRETTVVIMLSLKTKRLSRHTQWVTKTCEFKVGQIEHIKTVVNNFLKNILSICRLGNKNWNLQLYGIQCKEALASLLLVPLSTAQSRQTEPFWNDSLPTSTAASGALGM